MPHDAQMTSPNFSPHSGPAMYPQAFHPHVDPHTGEPLSDKNRALAGMLSLFLGGFGTGRFYLGHRSVGLAQFLMCTLGWFILLGWRDGWGVFILVCVWLWTVIDAFGMWLGFVRDSYGRKLR